MNCPTHIDAGAYIDDELPAAERQRFAAHLQECPLCRGQVEALSALQKDLRALPSPALGFDLAVRFEERLHTDKIGMGRRRPLRPTWIGWGAPGLAVAASMVAGIWLGGALGGAMTASSAMVRVFDPVPPGGLCAAAELCRVSKGSP